jgi:hypothetical protein
MWESRGLTTLWAFTSCYKDSFTLFIIITFVSCDVEMLRTIIRFFSLKKSINLFLNNVEVKSDAKELQLNSAHNIQYVPTILNSIKKISVVSVMKQSWP